MKKYVIVIIILVIISLIGIGIGLYFGLNRKNEPSDVISKLKNMDGEYLKFDSYNLLGSLNKTTKEEASEFVIEDGYILYVYRDSSEPKQYVKLFLNVKQQPTDPSNNSIRYGLYAETQKTENSIQIKRAPAPTTSGYFLIQTPSQICLNIQYKFCSINDSNCNQCNVFSIE
jgi:hypothetical protein